jgi:hypothetical protein
MRSGLGESEMTWVEWRARLGCVVENLMAYMMGSGGRCSLHFRIIERRHIKVGLEYRTPLVRMNGTLAFPVEDEPRKEAGTFTCHLLLRH